MGERRRRSRRGRARSTRSGAPLRACLPEGTRNRRPQTHDSRQCGFRGRLGHPETRQRRTGRLRASNGRPLQSPRAAPLCGRSAPRCDRLPDRRSAAPHERQQGGGEAPTKPTALRLAVSWGRTRPANESTALRSTRGDAGHGVGVNPERSSGIGTHWWWGWSGVLSRGDKGCVPTCASGPEYGSGWGMRRSASGSCAVRKRSPTADHPMRTEEASPVLTPNSPQLSAPSAE